MIFFTLIRSILPLHKVVLRFRHNFRFDVNKHFQLYGLKRAHFFHNSISFSSLSPGFFYLLSTSLFPLSSLFPFQFSLFPLSPLISLSLFIFRLALPLPFSFPSTSYISPSLFSSPLSFFFLPLSSSLLSLSILTLSHFSSLFLSLCLFIPPPFSSLSPLIFSSFSLLFLSIPPPLYPASPCLFSLSLCLHFFFNVVETK